MNSTQQYLDQLIEDKQTIVDNINTMGGSALDVDTFTELGPKILSIPAAKEEQTKSVTITQNKTTTITPDTGKVLSEVDVTTNVPAFVGIQREVDSNGVYKPPITPFEFALPNNATDLEIFALQYAFYNCQALTSVDLSSLTTVSGQSSLSNAFYGCRSLTSVELSSLTKVTGSMALSQAFYNCTSLRSLSFPSLTTTSFGAYTNQFKNMLWGVTGCTVHFPMSIQSKIGSWNDVTGGFGGTNTTVLFDIIQKITVDGVEYEQDVLNKTYAGYKAFKNGTSTIYVNYTNEPAVDDTVYSDGGTTAVGTISTIA